MTDHKAFLKKALFAAFSGVFIAGSSAYAAICSTAPNSAIADGSGSATPGAPTVVTIDVPTAYAGDVVDMDFDLQINHTYVGDLIVTLTSPAGTTVTLMDRPGRPNPFGTFGCFRDNINVTFDDEATTSVESQCDAANPTISGSHTPTGSLSDFDGEVYAGTWTITVTDNAGFDLGTVIPSGMCLGATTTAVNINAFETRSKGNRLIAEWQTASEAFNLGFHLWGEIEGEWVQLNKRLIASHSIDSTEPQNYRRRIKFSDFDGEITNVGISAFDTSGAEDFYGPFEIGEKYGSQELARYIDWGEQRRLYDERMRELGYTKLRGRWRRISERREQRIEKKKARYTPVTFVTKENGVYRISYEELLANGFDLNRMPIRGLAITRDGHPIPRIVNGSTANQRRFGSGADIVFYASGATSAEARYVDAAHYEISFDPEKAFSARTIDTSISNADTALFASTHLNRESFGQANGYSFALPGNHPWYDSYIRAYSNITSSEFSINLPDEAKIELPSELSIQLLGGLDFDNIDADDDGILNPDHHIKVYINRDQFPDAVYEGYAEGVEAISLTIDTNDQVAHGANSVEVELIPDNGYGIDVVYFLNASLAYRVDNNLATDYLNVQLDSTEIGLQFSSSTTNPAAFLYDKNGNFSRVGITPIDTEGTNVISLPQNPALENDRYIWLATDSGYLSPTEFFASAQKDQDELDLSNIDYVVVADPSLIGTDLQRFTDAQNEMGRATKVVSSKAIFDSYSSGRVLPSAIAQYLREQSTTSNFQYVLLVGGHTYNYRGYGTNDQEQPINLIPAFYRASDDLIKQIPTAVPFVDFDSDGKPDRAIGRWPVRDTNQLKHVVDKTLAWHADGSLANSKTSLLIAGANEAKVDFDKTTDNVAKSLGLPDDPWPQSTQIYMDELVSDPTVDAVELARQGIIDAINQGTALTVFSGHASGTSWGRQNLVTPSVVDQFTNADSPSLLMPLSCYTTYYETPAVKSLAEMLLTDSENGAVAISSAAVLSLSSDNEKMAKDLLSEMTVKGLDLGTAVLHIKRKIHDYSRRHQTLVYNWTTLGDPTLSFKLPDISPVYVDGQPKGSE